MKKILPVLLAALMMFGAPAAAQAVSQESAVKVAGENTAHTVSGFRFGSRSEQVDMTQRGGETRVPFNLGGSAADYRIEFDINRGEKYLTAAYDREAGEIVLTPKANAPRVRETEFEVEIDVVDRKTKELVSGDYYLTGLLTHDHIQEVQSGKHYHSGRGVLYDFGRGAKDVTIRAGLGVTLSIPRTPAGQMDLTLTDEGNASIDYMFSKHTLEYLNFTAQPKFPEAVEVRINSSAKHLYQYAGGRLQKVPGAKFLPGEGYSFRTKQLATYILTDDLINEGIVDEGKNLIRPF